MHFFPHLTAGKRGLAIARDGKAVDLAALDASLPAELSEVIAGGPSMLAAISKALAAYAGPWRAIAELTPAYPFQGHEKVLCVGLNYVAHAKEGGNAIPDYPAFFLRTRDSMLAAGEPMVRPAASQKLDYEAELMIVIGRTTRNISEADALGAIFGYTMFNDGSVRDYQRKGAQWTPGKNFDRTGPVGPVIATADSLPLGAHGLAISCRLNGETMQHSTTADMIFSAARIVSLASVFTTFHPGDMIAMGTPSGVGYARSTPVFLKPGDRVEVEIEGIGVLVNGVVDETAGA